MKYLCSVLQRGEIRRSFVRDRSGTSAVEFALVGGPFLILMMVLLDVSLTLWSRTALQAAVTDVQRLVRTGAAAGLSQARMKTQMCEAYRRLAFDNCSGLYVDLRTFNTGTRHFESAAPSLDDLEKFKFAYDAQPRGAIVLLRGFLMHELITPGIARLISPNSNKLLLQASELVWIEP